MKLRVNKEERDFPSAITLQQVLKSLSLPSTQGIALAVNEDVVHSSEWDTFMLKSGDSILLLQAVQGG